MTPNASWRAGLAGVIAVLMLAAAPLGYARVDTTQILHAAGHHGPGCSGGAPTITTCNAGMTSGMSGMGMPSSMSGTPDSMMTMEDFDLVFIDMMILHHESAIAMATVVVEESSDPVLAGLAQNIISTQADEIAKMQEWRDRWFRNIPAVETSSVSGMREMDHLAMMGIMDPGLAARMLRTAPETVDRAFVNAMILHHQGATMMFEMAVLHADHPEIAGLAGVMLESHHEQVMTMQEWQLA